MNKINKYKQRCLKYEKRFHFANSFTYAEQILAGPTQIFTFTKNDHVTKNVPIPDCLVGKLAYYPEYDFIAPIGWYKAYLLKDAITKYIEIQLNNMGVYTSKYTLPADQMMPVSRIIRDALDMRGDPNYFEWNIKLILGIGTNLPNPYIIDIDAFETSLRDKTPLNTNQPIQVDGYTLTEEDVILSVKKYYLKFILLQSYYQHN